jgi:hypothetical protein
LELAFITERSSLASCIGFTSGSCSEEHRLELLVLVSIDHIFDYFFITTILRTSLRNQKRYFGEAALDSFEYTTTVFIPPQVLQYFAWAIIHVSITGMNECLQLSPQRLNDIGVDEARYWHLADGRVGRNLVCSCKPTRVVYNLVSSKEQASFTVKVSGSIIQGGNRYARTRISVVQSTIGTPTI